MSESTTQPHSQLLSAVRDGKEQLAEKTERKARRQQLGERLVAAFRAIKGCMGPLLSPNQNPPDDGFSDRLAAGLRAFGAALNEADREYPRYLIRERLDRATRTGVPALDAAAQLLLCAPQTETAELGAMVQAVQADGRRDLWVAWLSYILDQLMNSHRPPGKLPLIPGTTRDDWRKADIAFGCVLFSDESFRVMQKNIDQAAAQVDAALKAGGYVVCSRPPARVRDLIQTFDPRALHWYGIDPPALGMLKPPPSIEAITQPETARRVLDEVWTAANLLQIALDKWVEWFAELQEKGDAEPAVALYCDDTARRAIKVLLVHRPNSAPFDQADEETLMAMLPPVPAWWMPGTQTERSLESGDVVEQLRVRWQEDREFLDRYYWPPERRLEQATQLRGAASQLVEMLTTFPETAAGTRRPVSPPGSRRVQPNNLEESQNAQVRPKRSTTKGEARVKTIAMFTAHHDYANGRCGNTAPIGVNELARKAQIAASSATTFFNKEFGREKESGSSEKTDGHLLYKNTCRRSPSELVTALKRLNNEYSPDPTYGSTPPGEDGLPDD
jgi:hypothetical protein